MNVHKLLLAALVGLVTAVCVVPAAHAELGIASLDAALSNPDGTPSRQAGAHPDLTLQAIFTTRDDRDVNGLVPSANIKDVHVDLPAGFVGNPTAAATCTPQELRVPNTSLVECPGASQIGVVRIATLPGATTAAFNDPNAGQFFTAGLYNMVHDADVPAKFSFLFAGAMFNVIPRLRADDGYAITADSVNLPQVQPVFGFHITLWGIPADPQHTVYRTGLMNPAEPSSWGVGVPSPDARRPFLSAPTSCTGEVQPTTVSMDSWENPSQSITNVLSTDFDGTPFLVQGCDRLSFAPTIDIQPVSHLADAPTGLDVQLKVPQNDSPDGLATPDVKRVAVTLPAGMSVSPSSAAGLGACAPSEIGLGSNAPDTCPDSSKIGTVEITTPLLAEPLAGDVILAKQNDNPFGSLLALYIVAPGPGFVLKLPGRVDADPVTGQLTTTFDNAPQLPFSDLHVRFYGGARAALATPAACGTYSTHTEITSWASDVPVVSDSPMVIDEGCGSRGFAPGFSAGVSSAVAGSSSPLTVTFSREDREQGLQGVDVTLPRGLLGNVGSVPLCPEAQAAAGTCAAASQLGHVDVLAGSGSAPLEIPEAGHAPTAVYLAGPYEGAPFSLSVVVPAQAGPFDLGTVVVRAGLFIDPGDAHVTVRSDPLPTILQGIPLRIRRVSVVVDRPGFIVSPTSCSPEQISGVVRSDQGAAASVASHFQVGDCASLSFKPRLTASTQAKTSRASGASLTVGITAKRGEANIHAVRLQLPGILPSRLTTLQKACTAAQFAANPGGCPAGSFIGSAKVLTPILAHPLTGPAILVSHGGEAFPDVVFVLQGEGVTIDLVGNTSIKKSVTTSTFGSVPDAPVSSFQATFPEGPHSVLAANPPKGSKGNLCSSAAKLVMPTTIVGQNGAQVTQTTKLAISGCPKAKSKARKATSKHKAGKRRAEK